MKKLIAVLISLLFVGSVFGVTSIFGVELIESKDFIFKDFDTEIGVIDDAESKDKTLEDAYDGAFELYIDDNWYGYAYWWEEEADYTTEAGGREYVLHKETMSGLTVYRKVYFPEDRNWVRYLEILHNPTVSPITVEVGIYSDLGSDDYTRVVMTSNGNKIADENDYWAVSDDEYGGNTKDDPSLAHVWDGPGGAKRVEDVLDYVYGDVDEITYIWKDVTVNPGQTVVLMHFGGLGMKNSDAIAIAQDLYNYNDVRMGYDLQEINLIINWSPARIATAGQKSLPMAQILKIIKANQDKE